MNGVFFLIVIYFTRAQAFTLPAGLRPAKALGEHNEVIVPGKTSTEHPLKEPANLSLRSRMLAALSASSKESENEVKTNANGPKVDQHSEATSTVAPLILTKGGKKGVAPQQAKTSESSVASKHEKILITTADGKRTGTVNFGLNTVLHTNLVDSKGRVMKGVNAVPIKVSTATDMKTSQTRHSASQVESEAEKVVPIKFGSS